jgi:CDP-diacylglycerol--serine O-phosphatidyltransferase
LAAFLYVATTALRLARFNVQDTSSSKNFTGLPCPAAAGMIATTILFCSFVGISAKTMGIPMLVLVYGLSYLMVSSVRYQSFKSSEATRPRRFQVLVTMVLLIMVIATQPEVTLFAMGVTYVLSGPLGTLYKLYARKEVAEEVEDQGKTLST